jgi:hypothetical protein
MAVSFTASGTPIAGGVQTTYPLAHDAFLEGQLADARPKVIDSYVNETSGVVAFGNLMVWNSGSTVADSARTISGVSGTVVGLNILTYVDETARDANNRPGAKDRQLMNVLRRGAAVVYVHGAVDPSTPVRVIHTASGVQYAGQFSASAVSGRTALLSNAAYVSRTTGSGLAVLDLNGPNFTLTANA